MRTPPHKRLGTVRSATRKNDRKKRTATKGERRVAELIQRWSGAVREKKVRNQFPGVVPGKVGVDRGAKKGEKKNGIAAPCHRVSSGKSETIRSVCGEREATRKKKAEGYFMLMPGVAKN